MLHKRTGDRTATFEQGVARTVQIFRISVGMGTAFCPILHPSPYFCSCVAHGHITLQPRALNSWHLMEQKSVVSCMVAWFKTPLPNIVMIPIGSQDLAIAAEIIF